MKISLCKSMVIKDGLTHEQAVEALKKASVSKAARYLAFSILGGSGINSWSLICRCAALTKKFLETPEDYVIELDNDKPICYLCKREIIGKVYYQGGLQNFPSHKKHLVTIKPSKKHGGGF